MVVGRIVATRKDDKLIGSKLLIIRPVTGRKDGDEDLMVAIDTVGAGMGEEVLVATGSAARLAADLDGRPVDAAIVGIVDTKELG
jgi:ethanolamine utilization protein EutN